jgi:hypothetical protein
MKLLKRSSTTLYIRKAKYDSTTIDSKRRFTVSSNLEMDWRSHPVPMVDQYAHLMEELAGAKMSGGGVLGIEYRATTLYMGSDRQRYSNPVTVSSVYT